MKILLVSQYFWPESFRVNDLVLAWQERGHEVTVLTGIPNYPGGRPFPGYSAFGPARQEFGTSSVIRVPLIPRGRNSRWLLAANYLSFVFTASLLGPLRCRGPFDWVFVNQLSPVTVGIPAALLKWRCGARMAFWIQDLWPESLLAANGSRSPLVYGLIGRLVNWIYRRSDLVLLQSRSFAEAVEARGVEPTRQRYLPNWCEDFYQPIELEANAAEREALPRGFVILFAGNLGAAQALDTILAAVRQVPRELNIHWVFLGDGRRREWLQHAIVNLGLGDCVHWLGSKPTTEMPRWFAAADALLVTLGSGPALAQTLPGKLQSYLACAKPILAALNGEGADVIKVARAGLVGPAEDAVALARNAEELVRQSPEERRRTGERARAYFLEHFRREALVDQLDGWLAEAPGP